MNGRPTDHRVLVVGGGFGGLYAARVLDRAAVALTVIDRRNFHLFQPLLYQVATGGLSPGDIASPIRSVLRGRQTSVLLGEVVDVDPSTRTVALADGAALPWDTLVIATGSSHHYFGHERWADLAPGLKTVEDAIEIRRRILSAFEKAERATDPVRRRMYTTFAIVGGGPTGVELAGALAELARETMRGDFRTIDPAETRIILFEAGDRVIENGFTEDLSEKAAGSLRRLGVTIRTRTLVTDIRPEGVTVSDRDGGTEEIPAGTVLWTAGVHASPLGATIAVRTGAKLDRAGRVIVEPDLAVPCHPDIFIIGDLARVEQDGAPLPGVAPVAIQEGEHVARTIVRRLRGEPSRPFRFRSRGTLAVIGRNSAVAVFPRMKLSGFFAWVVWLFVHIAYLIEYDNRVLVMVQWAVDYITRKRGARLITDGRRPASEGIVP